MKNELIVRQSQKLKLTQTGLDYQNQLAKQCSLGTCEFLAIPKERISEIEDKKLMVAEFGAIITKAYNFSGVKGTLTLFDKEDLLKMVNTRFKHLSLVEITKAFELERYCFYESKTDHFQLFNAEYVAKILQKFEKWKKQELYNNKSKIDGLLKIAPTELSEDEKKKIYLDAMESGLKRLTEEYSKQRKLSQANPHIFDYLKKIGEIKPPVGEERDLIVKKANKRLNLEKLKLSKGMLKSVEKQFVNKNSLNLECKRIMLEDYLSKKV